MEPGNFQQSQERRGSYLGPSRADSNKDTTLNPILKEPKAPKETKAQKELKVPKVPKVRKISAESFDTFCEYFLSICFKCLKSVI